MVKITEYFKIEIGGKRLKGMVKAFLKANLFEKQVLFEKPLSVCSDVFPPPLPITGLSLQQQKDFQ